MNIREIIIRRIREDGWQDPTFLEGYKNAIQFRHCADWVESLTDAEVLAVYDRMMFDATWKEANAVVRWRY